MKEFQEEDIFIVTLKYSIDKIARVSLQFHSARGRKSDCWHKVGKDIHKFAETRKNRFSFQLGKQ